MINSEESSHFQFIRTVFYTVSVAVTESDRSKCMFHSEYNDWEKLTTNWALVDRIE